MLIRAIENQIFRKAAPLAIRFLAKPDLKPKDSLSASVLKQCAEEFQMAPPVTIHSRDPELMAGVWSAAREAYVVNFKDRVMREAVEAAISIINECPYCVTVHASLFASTADDEKANLDKDTLPPRVQTAYDWAKATLSPNTIALKQHGLAAEDIPQVMGTAVVYHYVNRVVSVFLEDTPVALPGMASAFGEKLMRSSFTFFGKRFARLDPKPGQFAWGQQGELPPEFNFAKPDENIAKGLAQLALAVENAGQEAVPEPVRKLVETHLQDWQGEHPPLSRKWLEDLTISLEATHRPIAKLALLTARAPWQVDDGIIENFRAILPGDKALLQAAAWGSFAATKRIASWF